MAALRPRHRPHRLRLRRRARRPFHAPRRGHGCAHPPGAATAGPSGARGGQWIPSSRAVDPQQQRPHPSPFSSPCASKRHSPRAPSRDCALHGPPYARLGLVSARGGLSCTPPGPGSTWPYPASAPLGTPSRSQASPQGGPCMWSGRASVAINTRPHILTTASLMRCAPVAATCHSLSAIWGRGRGPTRCCAPLSTRRRGGDKAGCAVQSRVGGHVAASVPAPSLPHDSRAHLQQAAAWPWLLVSGPLGRPSVQLERYSHVVLIAGGIGITAVAPVFEATARGLPLSSTGPFARWLSCQRRAAAGVSPGGDGAAGDSVLLARGGTLSLLWTVR